MWIAGDAGLEAEVFAEMATHPFAEQLLPAVAVLAVGRIGVGFLEGGDVGVALLVGVIDAGGGGIEEALDAGGSRAAMHQMGVDENREHAKGAIVFDEAHPAHVGRQIIDVRYPVGHLF